MLQSKNMVTLAINDMPVQVEEGATILQAARKLGVEIPTFCHMDGRKPFTSCMICVVRDAATGQLLPSCSHPAGEGMVIETGSEPVREFRRETLNLLLSEHTGDCAAPCERICPTHMDIPRMLQQIMEGRLADAIVTVKRDIAFPAILGRICSAPCENGCHRGDHDAAVQICLLKRFVADVDLAAQFPYIPECAPASGKRVAIIGAGCAGGAAAYHLRRYGHGCDIFDEHDASGGAVRYAMTEEQCPRQVIEDEFVIVEKMGARFIFNTRVGRDIAMDRLRKEYDAIVLACGELTQDACKTLGLKYGQRGVKIDDDTLQSSDPQVFVCGGALRPTNAAVRSEAQAKAAAYAIDQLFKTGKAQAPPSRFDSKILRVSEDEIEQFMQGINPHARVEPAAGVSQGFTLEEARQEASRCMQCGCRKPDDCKLRDYAEEYGAGQKVYAAAERQPYTKLVHPCGVVFEPGKCLKCGVCVRLAREAGEELGLAFIGRGFDVRIAVPFNADLEKGLMKAAEKVVTTCPTGAMSFHARR
ncbi:(2Fe-2S)-binding protein [Candidatus Sumerlaeota bacterium]|nr:(2Fe-2S)-binding protein [Candidatus Sumerlaeota bacterium]